MGAFGHGANVAGIILQVAPMAKILPLRALGPDGSGDVATLKALCTRTGVRYDGREVHGLRHTAGTLMYARTKNLRAVAQHLRHSQLDTAAIYAEMDDSEVRGAFEGVAL